METFTAVFDGKVLVLQQPVDWQAGDVVEVVSTNVKRREQREALERLLSRARHGGGADFDRGDLYP